MTAAEWRWTDKLVRALPAEVYGDPEIFARERQTVFSKSWRLIGHTSMMPEAGDFITDDLAAAPIILVRSENGAVNGFYNVCRHRAGPLATERTGNCRGEIVCRYHGWRYALDGRLRSATRFGSVAGFDPRDYGLRPVRVEQWRGFIFANLDNTAAPIAKMLAPLDEVWRASMDQPFALRRSHEIACDWKVYVENYLEGYHVPNLHPKLDEDIDSSNYQVEMRGNVAIHHAPPRKQGVYCGLWGWVFPLTGFNGFQHGVLMERITPVAPRRTRLEYLYFFNPDRRAELNAMIELSDITTAEDIAMCEQVQINLDSGAYCPGPLSPQHEESVGWFQAEMREHLGIDAS